LVHGGDVLGGEQENARRVLVQRLERGPPRPARLIAVRRGGDGTVYELVDLRIEIAFVVRAAEARLGPRLREARGGRGIGVPHVEQRVEPAGPGALVEDAGIDLVELHVDAGRAERL